MTEKILITDDDKSIRATLELILGRHKYRVDTAKNGVEALEKIKYGDFDIVILDYKLPDTNGIVLAREIKAENEIVEVIILSGKATLESAIKAVKEDVFDYLIKPVNPDDLLKVIDGALEKQRLIREKQELIWELKKKNKKLENLSKFKSGLISMLSHDLRSPISSLKGFNESFLRGFLGEITPQQRDIIETENRVIDAMVELINGLLDMEQLEAGKLKMKKKPSSIIDDVVVPVLERLSIQAKEKNIKIDINTDTDLPEINMDHNRIAQVVQNLLQNALKFTPEKGDISISVENSDMGIEVSVEDSGKGIEHNKLNEIFQAFHSGEGSGGSGRGLGLAISREIVRAHNGTIWAESKGRNRGSRFVFVLPLENPEKVEAQNREDPGE